MGRLLPIVWLWLALFGAAFGETLPPKPDAYFNDYAHVVSAQTASALDAKLRQFERDTSSQIVVAVYPKMQTESSIQDYTFRIAESWHVGQKEKNNGAVLFVFTGDRKMFMQVGYGLEGALPDATAKRIIAEEIAPAFKAGKYDAGLTAGVDAMIAATKGEYKGSGRVAGAPEQDHSSSIVLVFFSFMAIFWIWNFFRSLRGVAYGSRGRRSASVWPIFFSGGGGGGSSWGGGGGGGFSGGGGSFGGGGAGGDW